MTDQTYSPDEFVRTVTFVDRRNPPDRDEVELPVHMTSDVLLNGQQTEVRMVAQEGWSATSAGSGGLLIVTFVVHPEDCVIGYEDDEGYYHPHMLGERKVVVPTNPPWETLHTSKPIVLVGEGGKVTQRLRELVRVSMIVGEVHAIRQPMPEAVS